MLTVKEMIELLSQYPEDAIVSFSGNHYYGEGFTGEAHLSKRSFWMNTRTGEEGGWYDIEDYEQNKQLVRAQFVKLDWKELDNPFNYAK